MAFSYFQLVKQKIYIPTHDWLMTSYSYPLLQSHLKLPIKLLHFPFVHRSGKRTHSLISGGKKGKWKLTQMLIFFYHFNLLPSLYLSKCKIFENNIFDIPGNFPIVLIPCSFWPNSYYFLQIFHPVQFVMTTAQKICIAFQPP